MSEPTKRMAQEQAPESGVLDSAPMDMSPELLSAVRGHYLFSGLDDPDFKQLALHMSGRSLDVGETLFNRGDAAGHFYFVDRGLIELSVISPTGDKKVLEVVGAGRTFGEAVAFMRERRFPVSAAALVESELCQIQTGPFVSLLESNAAACLRLLADISRHLHARVRDIENLSIQNARSRVSSYLLEHISSRSGDEATVRLELPKHVIASRLSIQPETLSRILRQLSRESIITVDDRLIYISDITRLRPWD